MKRFIVMEGRHYYSDVTGIPYIRYDGTFETEEKAYAHVVERTKDCKYHKTNDGRLLFPLSPKYESEFFVHKQEFKF